MLSASVDDAMRTAVFAETILALKKGVSTRLEALLLTDGNLVVIGDSPVLPPYLAGVVEIISGRLTARKRENLVQLCAAVGAALPAKDMASVPFKLSTDIENVFVYGAAERAAFAAKTPMVLFSFVHPQARGTPCVTKLQAWFGLSKSESAIAAALAAGKDVAEIATAKSLSELTVRTHLRTIFEKTNTHSQRDLVALLLRLAGI